MSIPDSIGFPSSAFFHYDIISSIRLQQDRKTDASLSGHIRLVVT